VGSGVNCWSFSPSSAPSRPRSEARPEGGEAGGEGALESDEEAITRGDGEGEAVAECVDRPSAVCGVDYSGAPMLADRKMRQDNTGTLALTARNARLGLGVEGVLALVRVNRDGIGH
jgi:hypothetical protein